MLDKGLTNTERHGKLILMNRNELSPLADAILDGYWTLCSGKDAIQFAIGDYLSRTPESGMLPYTMDGETPVTPEEFMLAISEVLDYFDFTSEKDKMDTVRSTRLMERLASFRRHPVSRGR
jgi:hypothetical protein